MSATIGASGGELRSLDGDLAVIVPPGAVPEGTVLTAQPITNTAPGAFGPAYRLTKPDGVSFAVPVTVQLRYGDPVAAGTAVEALYVGTQRADGTWRAETPTVDAAAMTLSVTTTHFSDWASLTGLQIIPAKATVRAGQRLPLTVKSCAAARYEVDGTDLVGTSVAECTYTLAPTSEWSVNGQVGGSATHGTIAGGNPAVYQAPQSAPSPAEVTVSTRAAPKEGAADRLLISSRVTVKDFKGYAGAYSGRFWVRSRGELFIVNATAMIGLEEVYRDANTASYQLSPLDTAFDVSFYRYESSSETCSLSGVARVVDDSIVGWLDVLVDGNTVTYSWSGQLALSAPVTCVSKSSGESSQRTMEGLGFIFGTHGLDAPSTLEARDVRVLRGEDVLIRASDARHDGFETGQSWELVRTE